MNANHQISKEKFQIIDFLINQDITKTRSQSYHVSEVMLAVGGLNLIKHCDLQTIKEARRNSNLLKRIIMLLEEKYFVYKNKRLWRNNVQDHFMTSKVNTSARVMYIMKNEINSEQQHSRLNPYLY